jgi:regulator of nucleoside diphosphate kinase
MPKKIYITQTDKQRLLKIISDELDNGHALDISMKKLKEEITGAKVIDSRDIPRDAITMNSRVLLSIDEEDIEASLVYPRDADWSANKLSVLSPSERLYSDIRKAMLLGGRFLPNLKNPRKASTVPAGVIR